MQDELRKAVGKPKRDGRTAGASTRRSRRRSREYALPKLREALAKSGKHERYAALDAGARRGVGRARRRRSRIAARRVGDLVDELKKQVVREAIVRDGRRIDGRGLADIRPITCEVDVLPRTHGSALFTRGETQALVVDHARHVVRRAEDRRADRRALQEVHAALQLPAVQRRRGEVPARPGPARDRPRRARRARHRCRCCRTRTTSRTPSASSPRSSSRTARRRWRRCAAASLGADGRRRADQGAGRRHRHGPHQGRRRGPRALRHPRRRGPPRRHGLQGRRHRATGITALQMDIKIGGVTRDDHAAGAGAGARGRLHILGRDGRGDRAAAHRAVDARAAHRHAQDQARQDPRRHRPRRQGHPRHHRGDRRQDRHRGRRHGADRLGRRRVACRRRSTASGRITAEAEVGKIYKGTVRKIVDFGAFVEILPGTDGLVHISQLGHERVRQVTDVAQRGRRDQSRSSRSTSPARSGCRARRRCSEAECPGAAATLAACGRRASRTASACSPRSCPDLASVTVGIWVENGSRYEPRDAGRHLALPRAPLLQGHRAPDGGADRRGDRRRRRRAQRVHRQGVHLLLRARCCASTCRWRSTCSPTSSSHSRFDRGGDRARAHGDPPGDLAGRGHARRLRPRPVQPGVLAGPSAARPVAGTAATVGPLQRPDFLRFLEARYRPDRVLIAAAGNVEHDELVERRVAARSASSPARPRAADGSRRRPAPGCRCTRSRSSRCTSASGRPGIAHADPDRYAAHLLNTALGGGMSSRLFQEVRERRGRAYSVYSFLSSYRDAGYLGVYVGTSAEWVREVVDVIQAELRQDRARRARRRGAGARQEPDQGQHAARARDQRQPHEPHRARTRSTSGATCRSTRSPPASTRVTNDDVDARGPRDCSGPRRSRSPSLGDLKGAVLDGVLDG